MVGDVLKFKKGDRINILSFEKIKSGLDFSSEHDTLFFAHEMEDFCGQTVTLRKKNRKKVWLLSNGWYWHEDWFEAIPEDFFTDEDFRL